MLPDSDPFLCTGKLTDGKQNLSNETARFHAKTRMWTIKRGGVQTVFAGC